MTAAVLMFGFGGVLMNIVHYLQSGLEGFSSFPGFAVGVSINAFGLIWNALAAIGAYQR